MLAIGAILAAMIYAGGPISGAHYNPAVTLAVFLRGHFSAVDVVPYWIAQVLGAVVAAIAVTFLKGGAIQGVQPLDLSAQVPQAFLAEFLFTLALCYVILNVTASKAVAGNSYFGLAIGMTVVAGGLAVGDISGGVFNPAVVVGGSMLKLLSWKWSWLYFAASFTAAATAAMLFTATHPPDQAE